MAFITFTCYICLHILTCDHQPSSVYRLRVPKTHIYPLKVCKNFPPEHILGKKGGQCITSATPCCYLVQQLLAQSVGKLLVFTSLAQDLWTRMGRG